MQLCLIAQLFHFKLGYLPVASQYNNTYCHTIIIHPTTGGNYPNIIAITIRQGRGHYCAVARDRGEATLICVPLTCARWHRHRARVVVTRPLPSHLLQRSRQKVCISHKIIYILALSNPEYWWSWFIRRRQTNLCCLSSTTRQNRIERKRRGVTACDP